MTRLHALPVHPLADLFPLIEGAEFAALCRDIAENGLHEPIVLWRGALLDGRNRYRALVATRLLDENDGAEAALAARPECFEDRSDLPVLALAAFVVSRNLVRRHLDESQRALIAARLADLGPGRRKRVADGAAVGAASPPSSPLAGEGEGLEETPQICGVSRDAAARMLNVSERSLDSARRLVATAPAEVVAEVARGETAVSAAVAMVDRARAEAAQEVAHEAAARVPPESSDAAAEEKAILAAYERIKAERAAAREAKKAARAEKERALGQRIADANLAMLRLAKSGKRYGVILADPEWRFETWSEAGRDRGAENHYPTTPTEEIARRPVRHLAADDAVLFLWATAPMLPDALRVMEAWGFAYRTHLVWVTPGEAGTGYWFRSEHELLLLGVRGRPPAPAPGTQWNSVLLAPAGKHSEKPSELYELIEQYFPTLPKIELNARSARPGWDRWGAEAPEEAGATVQGPVRNEVDAARMRTAARKAMRMRESGA